MLVLLRRDAIRITTLHLNWFIGLELIFQDIRHASNHSISTFTWGYFDGYQGRCYMYN